MWLSRRSRDQRRRDGVYGAVDPRVAVALPRTHGLTVALPRELARSRRHRHQLSLILLRESAADGGPRLVDVIDRLVLRLRATDLLMDLEDGRLLIVCPETTVRGARVLLSDIVALLGAEGVEARASTATFPKTALTASELLRACERDVEDVTRLTGPAAAWDDGDDVGSWRAPADGRIEHHLTRDARRS